MSKAVKRFLKFIIYNTVPNSFRLRYIVNIPLFTEWKKKYKGKPVTFNTRFEMFDFINKNILTKDAIDYLEFGVYKGDSIKYFSSINSNNNSTFTGFDSLEGLPEDWLELSRTVKSNTFDVEGKLPETDDTRISFIKGMFQTTLSNFIKGYKSNNQMVIHIDCDIYSATLFVLTHMNELIKPGTIIIFDEFYSLLHEFRALEDYSSSYLRDYQVVSMTDNYDQVAIKML